MRFVRRHAVTALFLIAMLAAAIRAPARNWDMLCYVASVSAWTLDTPEAIYQATMANVAATAPEWLVQQFSANPLSSSAANFAHVLPMCQVKPLYNLSVWAVSGIAGLPLSSATSIVSALAFAALTLFMLVIPLKECPRPVWLGAILGLTFLGEGPMAQLPRLSTPDSLCTSFMVLAAASLLAKREALFAAAALLASLARPDAEIPMMFLAVWSVRDCWRSPRGRTWMIPAGCIVSLILAQTLVGRFAHSYTLEKMFYYSFMNRTPAIASLSDNLVSADAYLGILSSGFGTLMATPRFWVVAAMALLGGASYYLIPAKSVRRHAAVLAVLCAAFVIRFLIWPIAGEDRFYFGYFLISLYCSLELLFPCLKVAHAAILGWRAALSERYRRLEEAGHKAT